MKKIMLTVVLFFVLTGPAFADYSVTVKNEDTGVIIKTYTVITKHVAHLIKTKDITGISVLDQFEQALSDMVILSKMQNRAYYRKNHSDELDDLASE